MTAMGGAARAALPNTQAVQPGANGAPTAPAASRSTGRARPSASALNVAAGGGAAPTGGAEPHRLLRTVDAARDGAAPGPAAGGKLRPKNGRAEREVEVEAEPTLRNVPTAR